MTCPCRLRHLVPVLLAAFAFMGEAGAALRECGTYRIEGKVASIRREGQMSEVVFLANEDSAARVEFRLAVRAETARARLAAGARAELVLKVDKRCEFRCAGTLVEVGRLLEPWRPAETFNASVRPLEASACRD